MTEPTTPHMEIRHLEPELYACIAATTVPQEVGATLARVLPAVGAYLSARGFQTLGAPLARYYRYDAAVVEMDAGVRIAGHATGDGDVVIKELPGGDVAVAIHMGSYATLQTTHRALATWLERTGRTPRAAPWEVYVTDPMAQPDTTQWRTEIYWPVT